MLIDYKYPECSSIFRFLSYRFLKNIGPGNNKNSYSYPFPVNRSRYLLVLVGYTEQEPSWIIFALEGDWQTKSICGVFTNPSRDITQVLWILFFLSRWLQF